MPKSPSKDVGKRAVSGAHVGKPEKFASEVSAILEPPVTSLKLGASKFSQYHVFCLMDTPWAHRATSNEQGTLSLIQVIKQQNVFH